MGYNSTEDAKMVHYRHCGSGRDGFVAYTGRPAQLPNLTLTGGVKRQPPPTEQFKGKIPGYSGHVKGQLFTEGVGFNQATQLAEEASKTAMPGEQCLGRQRDEYRTDPPPREGNTAPHPTHFVGPRGYGGHAQGWRDCVGRGFGDFVRDADPTTRAMGNLEMESLSKSPRKVRMQIQHHEDSHIPGYIGHIPKHYTHNAKTFYESSRQSLQGKVGNDFEWPPRPEYMDNVSGYAAHVPRGPVTITGMGEHLPR